MKKFMAIAALLVATLTVSAQDYNWAVGLRSYDLHFNGVVATAKKYNDKTAIEAGLAFGKGYFYAEGVYLWQQPVITDGLALYYGAGANLGVAGGFAIKAEAVVGLEYQIPISVPLAVSLDYRPSLGILPEFPKPDFYGLSVGLKYCF